MKKPVKTVGLFGKYRDTAVAKHVVDIHGYLLRRGLTVITEEESAKLTNPPLSPGIPLADIGARIDLAIVLGGDGTILQVARVLATHAVPVVGVNQGRLGFLADVSVDSMQAQIGAILDGEFEAETRHLLQADINRKGKVIHSAVALNDVILTKGELARMIEFETYLDGEFVNSIRGDGMIVASPTGSTAYALSAGGPVLHPTLPALAVVPICPHTLTNRPIVVSHDSVVEFVLTSHHAQQAHVTFDGQTTFTLEPNDHVFVRRATTPIELIHPAGHSHYDVLREKLHWGRKL
jgi:NAD+ kinase